MRILQFRTESALSSFVHRYRSVVFHPEPASPFSATSRNSQLTCYIPGLNEYQCPKEGLFQIWLYEEANILFPLPFFWLPQYSSHHKASKPDLLPEHEGALTP